MRNFKIKYLFIGIILVLTEILIAIYAKDDFIRPIVGDYLASIVVFYLLAFFNKFSVKELAIITLFISYTIEALQYFKILEKLKLDHIIQLKIVLGSSFSWIDMLAYTLGVLTVILIHKPKK